MPAIQVLLSSYNGARFLPELLASLCGQTASNWQILARDDGSTDRTPDQLQQFACEHPERICFLDGTDNLGPSGSFSTLFEASSAPYLCFCDQDDVWMPEKIERTFACMQELEQRHGGQTPLLTHTDLEVVAGDLQPLSPSLWQYQRLDPRTSQQLNRQLVMNSVTGCTVMINRALADLAGPIPPEAVMHDWWLALCASAFGKVGILPESTIRYRQHGANDTGAKSFGPRYWLCKALTFWKTGELTDTTEQAQAQAQAFLGRFHDRLSDSQRELIAAHAGLKKQSWLKRRKTIYRYGLWKTGLVRNLGLLVRI